MSAVQTLGHISFYGWQPCWKWWWWCLTHHVVQTLDWKRKPKMRSACKLQTEELANPGPSCCEMRGLTTTPNSKGAYMRRLLRWNAQFTALCFIPSLCNWLLDFLTGRPHVTHRAQSQWTQCAELPSALFANSQLDRSNLFIKIVDYTTVGLISNKNQTNKIQARWAVWLSGAKTIFLWMRKKRKCSWAHTQHAPLIIKRVIWQKTSPGLSTHPLKNRLEPELSLVYTVWVVQILLYREKCYFDFLYVLYIW